MVKAKFYIEQYLGLKNGFKMSAAVEVTKNV